MADISRAELKYRVERQREEIQTLNEAGRLLSAATDPHAIVHMVAAYLRRAFPVALCGILFLPQRKCHLIPFAPIAQVELTTAARQMREAAGQLLNRTVAEDESPIVLEEPAAGGWVQPSIALRSRVFSPLTDKGQPIGILGVFSGQDNAFSKEDQHAIGVVAEQLGAALRNAFLVDELQRAGEVKTEMLSIVSHELSTPLTAIKEGVNLVLEGALGQTTQDQQDFLKTVMENAERLERLIQKVKTTTELLTGQTKFTFESFDLRTLMANIEKSHRMMARSRGVNLKLVEYPKPVFWQVDMAHLTTALNQIVENAIQATEKDGFVTLKLYTTPTEAEIQVLDTGAGIAKEALPTLFEQFKSIGGIHDRKMGGLGLGLYITKSLITGHGGTIIVDSTPGEGTLMIVHLPKLPQAPAA